MTGGLRRKLARFTMRRRVARYGNNHSRDINLHYRAYHEAAQAAFDPKRHPISAAAQAQAETLARDGFLVLPPEDGQRTPAAELGARVDMALADPGNCYPVSAGMIRLIDGSDMFPELFALLRGRVEDVIHAYFLSYFKIFSATLYRTVPDDSVPESSFLWHFDNAPDQQIKAMIYLDDTVRDTGAFRFKSRAVSEQARSRGFWHRDDYDLARPVFDDETTTHTIEGPPGTVILFQPGRVVHKATAPRHGHRDVAVLVINPSKAYWREHLARHRHLLSTNAGLCLNLDTDLPENMGYRF